MHHFDYVIVGSGPAGCALAARLSEDPSCGVALVEAGGPDSKLEIKIPAAFPKLFKTEYDWAFFTEPEPQLNDRRLFWPRGKTLGGSTALNAQMFIRGRDTDFDAWAELGASGWDSVSVRPYFERSQLTPSALRDPNPLTAVFLAAAVEAGLSAAATPDEADDGVAQTPVTQRAGRRFSAADAYLRPIRGRANLTVLTGTAARRVLLDGRRATGVECDQGGRRVEIRARREVILSAGAIGSPALLLRSGVGPARELAAVGVDAVTDLPGVGKNLQDHAAVAVVYGCTAPLTLVAAERPVELLRFFLRGRGMLTSNVGEAAAFVRTRAGLPGPDLELIWAPVPFIDHGLVKPAGHGITIGAVLLQPKSTGEVTLASPDLEAPPRIRANYLSDPGGEDLRVLVEGVRRAREIFGQPSFAPYLGQPVEPRAGLRDDQLPEFVRAELETLYHPVGTCRIGRGPDAVVDPDLRVHGVEGLRVADASVMPRITRGHPQAVVAMIGERAADLVRGRATTSDQRAAAVATA